MVLDPMSALSIAANIVQFVDFTSKIVSKGRRIYLSKDGALPKNLELGVVTNDLSRLAKNLANDGVSVESLSDEQQSLQLMSQDCTKIAEELLSRLENLQVKSEAKQRGWKSLRQALKSVWNKEELDELSERLSQFRDQLQFHILVSLKESMELQNLRHSERFDDLSQAAQSLLISMLQSQEIFTSQISNQTITITDLHLETRALIQKEARRTRAEFLCALNVSQPAIKGYKSKQYDLSLQNVTSSWDDHFQVQDMILQSLRFPSLKHRYESITEAHAKTFEWIFKKPNDAETRWDDFSDWLRHGDGIYWVSGKAGSGKSTLMRYIHDHLRLRSLLQDWAAEGEDLIIATFFFWISGVSDQSSQVGLLRSLLFELLSSKPHLIEATMPDLWSNLRSSVSPIQYLQTYSWTLSRVTKCFKRLFSIISQDAGYVFLLIDGLDEYQGDPTDTIKLLLSVISPNVKICVSSRPWQVFEVAFKNSPKLRLQYLTFEDIKCYVIDRLLSNEQMQKLCNVDPVGAPKLIEEIVEKAAGVFLWVTLVIKSFLNGLTNLDSISYFRKRLKEIPSELEDLYTYMLSKIEPIYYEEGRKLFSIVSLASHEEDQYNGGGICAVRLFFAMEDSEDLTAPPQRPDGEKVISMVGWVDTRMKVCCAGLLEISSPFQKKFGGELICLNRSGNRQFQYIHRTARDFLLGGGSRKPPEWICPLVVDNTPTRLMRANIMYLKSRLWEQDETESVSALNYLKIMIERTMWLARKAEREILCHNAELLDALESTIQFFVSPIDWGDLLWRESSNLLARSNWFDDFLCVAIVWKLNLYLKIKLGEGKEIMEAKRGRSYLDYAVRYFFDYIRPEDEWDLETISILLEHGGNPNLQFSAGVQMSSSLLIQCTPWEFILSTAASRGRLKSSKEVFWSLLAPLFELMLNYGADPYATSIPGTLSGASVTGIISQHLGSSFLPENYKKLRQLVEEATDRSQRSPSRRVGRMSRLKNRLWFSR